MLERPTDSDEKKQDNIPHESNDSEAHEPNPMKRPKSVVQTLEHGEED